MKCQRKHRQRAGYILPLKDRYQMYESEKKNPDPSMTHEAWVKNIAKKFKV